MIEDDDILNDFVVESSEHLADIENQLLTIESNGADLDVDLVNTVFRGVHSIKGAAGFLGLTTINRLAHSLENVLNLIRENQLIPTGAIIDVLLSASDLLRQLIEDVKGSNRIDVADSVRALDAIAEGNHPDASTTTTEPSSPAHTTAPAEVPEQGSLEATSPVAQSNSATPPNAMPPNAMPQNAMPPNAMPQNAPSQNEGAPTPTPPQQSTSIPAERSTSSTMPNSDKPTKATRASVESNIRVPVETLDLLMNLAGELVLARNQLMQTIGSIESKGLEVVASRINQVTSELQDAIMQTRMQPIGNVFSRFTRVVRDLSTKLGKDCDLTIEGKEVEVDKTILEAIGDPLTHLVRNAVDHGLETPAERSAAGKPAKGLLQLRALHQSDKVRILIQDDGRGLNLDRIKQKAVEKGLLAPERAHELSDREIARLIFQPGFSTAEKLSDVSGRGVGMDVVRTNIEKLGGTVEIESKANRGSTIEVTLPLTLAIIPSLIVACQDERFAIPQSSIGELVRINPSDLQQRIGKVKSAEVLRLRGRLLPLVRLQSVLGMQPREDQQLDVDDEDSIKALNIVVVDTGQQSYGLVVDELFDSEEIVVRPLGRHFKDCHCMSGATILGDGRVALILDVVGIANQAELRSIHAAQDDTNQDSLAETQRDDSHSVLLFRNHPSEQFSIPAGIVARIERIEIHQIDSVGGMKLLQYGGTSLPLLALEDHIKARPREESERVYVAVFDVSGREIGLIIPSLEDIRDVDGPIDMETLREPGVIGSQSIGDAATRMIDLFELAEKAHPEWFVKKKRPVSSNTNAAAPVEVQPTRILLAEDSDFFRKQVKRYLLEAEYEVLEAEDGLQAWNMLQADPNVDVVVTDIQMPHLTGFELCERIKNHDATKHLPVVALTSLAGEEDMKRGEAVGIDEYQVKMDRERLLAAVEQLAQGLATSSTAAANYCEGTV